MPQVRKSTAPPAPLVSITTAAAEPPEPEKQEEKKELSPTWFWDLTAGIASDEWGKIYDLWLLRRGESKVPMGPGEKGYLDQFMQPITPAVIKSRYGGGLYRIVLNKNGRFKTSHDFEIEGTPSYSNRERPGTNGHAQQQTAGNDATLQVLQQFRELLRDEFVRRADNGQASSANEEAIKLLSSASERAMEVITKQVPQAANPASQLADLVTVIDKLRPAPAPQNNDLLTSLLVPLLKPLIEKMLTPANPLEQLNQLATAMEVLEKIRGGEGKPKDWKAMVVDHVPEILSTAKDMLQSNAEAAKERRAGLEAQRATAETLRQLPPGQPAAAAPAVPAAAAANPQSVRVPQASVLATEALRTVPITAADTAAPAPAGFDVSAEAYVAFIKTRVVELIETGSSGESIVDFLDGAKPEFSQQLVQYPAEIVTSFFRADAILYRAVANPRWNQVLEEARAYILENEEPKPVEKPN